MYPPSTSGSLRLAVPIPALKSHHPRAAADAPLRHRPVARGAQRLGDVLLVHVAPGDVVQPGVVALAHERDDDVVLVPDARVALDHPLHRRVRHGADGERVREEDRRLDEPPLEELRHPRDLAGPVQDEPAADDPFLEYVPRVREDGGDPGADRTLADLQRPAARMMVECPTFTPATSVIAFQRPGLYRPSGIPSSRARRRGLVRGAVVGHRRDYTGGAPSPEVPEGLSGPFGPGLEPPASAVACAGRSTARASASLRRRLRAPGPLRPLALLVATDREREDLADEAPVLDAGGLGDEDEVRPAWRESRQRVALDEVDPALRVHAEVDRAMSRHPSAVKHSRAAFSSRSSSSARAARAPRSGSCRSSPASCRTSRWASDRSRRGRRSP